MTHVSSIILCTYNSFVYRVTVAAVETLCTTRVRETFLVLASVPGPVFLSLFQHIKQLMLFVLDENLTDFCVKTLLRLNIPSRFLR